MPSPKGPDPNGTCVPCTAGGCVKRPCQTGSFPPDGPVPWTTLTRNMPLQISNELALSCRPGVVGRAITCTHCARAFQCSEVPPPVAWRVFRTVPPSPGRNELRAAFLPSPLGARPLGSQALGVRGEAAHPGWARSWWTNRAGRSKGRGSAWGVGGACAARGQAFRGTSDGDSAALGGPEGGHGCWREDVPGR